MIRVVVADDHAVVRAGVRALFADESDVLVVAEAADGLAAVAEVARHTPDVLVIDLTMPGCNGVEAIARVRALGVATRVLVLSMHAEAEYVRPALRAGAHGYVVKGSGLDHLVRALRELAGGGRFLDSAVLQSATGDCLSPATEDDPLERLTPREREVLQLIAEGRTNRDIADRLGLSFKTVDSHRTSLMRKLDVHNAQALTRFALRHRLISE